MEQIVGYLLAYLRNSRESSYKTNVQSSLFTSNQGLSQITDISK